MDPIVIGRVRTSHGLDGSVKAQSYSGEIRHFRTLKTVELRDGERKRSFTVESVRIHGLVPILKLAGLDSPETAKTFAGWEIVVDRAYATPLDTGEIYQSDLIGLTVRVGERTVGTVLAVYDGPQSVLLEVETTDGNKLVPYMSRYIGDVDTGARTIELLEEWILE